MCAAEYDKHTSFQNQTGYLLFIYLNQASPSKTGKCMKMCCCEFGSSLLVTDAYHCPPTLGSSQDVDRQTTSRKNESAKLNDQVMRPVA